MSVVVCFSVVMSLRQWTTVLGPFSVADLSAYVCVCVPGWLLDLVEDGDW